VVGVAVMEELSTLDIVDKIYCKCKYPRKAIMDMYLMMLETLEEEFIKGNSVKFPGICTFTIKEYHKKGLSPQALGR
jgi:nucleoid DNA-binding protein